MSKWLVASDTRTSSKLCCSQEQQLAETNSKIQQLEEKHAKEQHDILLSNAKEEKAAAAAAAAAEMAAAAAAAAAASKTPESPAKTSKKRDDYEADCEVASTERAVAKKVPAKKAKEDRPAATFKGSAKPPSQTAPAKVKKSKSSKPLRPLSPLRKSSVKAATAALVASAAEDKDDRYLEDETDLFGDSSDLDYGPGASIGNENDEIEGSSFSLPPRAAVIPHVIYGEEDEVEGQQGKTKAIIKAEAAATSAAAKEKRRKQQKKKRDVDEVAVDPEEDTGSARKKERHSAKKKDKYNAKASSVTKSKVHTFLRLNLEWRKAASFPAPNIAAPGAAVGAPRGAEARQAQSPQEGAPFSFLSFGHF